ncbi:MAG: DNA recombination protein RmuC [Caulobacter sp.]|nr:DNA recombination protein RmuC [Caulobacter sp.]
MNAAFLALIVAAAFALLAVVALAWALMERRRAGAAEARAWAMKEQFASVEARAKLLEEQSGAASELLKAQAAQQAGAVAEELLKRTEESFRNRETLAQARIEAQLKPVAETLAKFEAQVTAVEKTRAEEQGGLKAQIAALMDASAATQTEARKLSAALRRGAGVQGRWGEQTLRNVLEAAGLANQYDFVEQFSLDTEEGRRRPDVKVRMPAGAVFAIDAKCSLNAFMDAQEAVDDAAREAAMARHAQSVKSHMQGLSAKAYWDQFASERSPDFVAMFVPGDGFLAAALDRMPDLMTEAMDRRVLLVTPTTLFALCKAVAYGWRVEEQAANADKIAALGRDLHARLSVMGGHVAAMGKALEAATGKYNQFVGSLESQVLTQARRFEDLKVDHQGKDLPELAPIEGGLRPLTKLTSSSAHPDESRGPETGHLTGSH